MYLDSLPALKPHSGWPDANCMHIKEYLEKLFTLNQKSTSHNDKECLLEVKAKGFTAAVAGAEKADNFPPMVPPPPPPILSVKQQQQAIGSQSQLTNIQEFNDSYTASRLEESFNRCYQANVGASGFTKSSALANVKTACRRAPASDTEVDIYDPNNIYSQVESSNDDDHCNTLLSASSGSSSCSTEGTSSSSTSSTSSSASSSSSSSSSPSSSINSKAFKLTDCDISPQTPHRDMAEAPLKIISSKESLHLESNGFTTIAKAKNNNNNNNNNNNQLLLLEQASRLANVNTKIVEKMSRAERIRRMLELEKQSLEMVKKKTPIESYDNTTGATETTTFSNPPHTHQSKHDAKILSPKSHIKVTSGFSFSKLHRKNSTKKFNLDNEKHELNSKLVSMAATVASSDLSKKPSKESPAKKSSTKDLFDYARCRKNLQRDKHHLLEHSDENFIEFYTEEDCNEVELDAEKKYSKQNINSNNSAVNVSNSTTLAAVSNSVNNNNNISSINNKANNNPNNSSSITNISVTPLNAIKNVRFAENVS
jgi:hypothetical protein